MLDNQLHLFWRGPEHKAKLQTNAVQCLLLSKKSSEVPWEGRRGSPSRVVFKNSLESEKEKKKNPTHRQKNITKTQQTQNIKPHGYRAKPRQPGRYLAPLMKKGPNSFSIRRANLNTMMSQRCQVTSHCGKFYWIPSGVVRYSLYFMPCNEVGTKLECVCKMCIHLMLLAFIFYWIQFHITCSLPESKKKKPNKLFSSVQGFHSINCH